MSLGETIDQDQVASPPPPAGRQGRGPHPAPHDQTSPDIGDDSVPFFDARGCRSRVIELSVPEAEGLVAEQYDVIGDKNSYRLAQRPGSYVVLNYRRPVIKLKETQAIVCPAAPVGVIDGSRADVSFLAGMLIDKFAWHLPFYRQHQRLADAGITVSRPWLTQLGQQAIALLEPIYDASSPRSAIRASRRWTRPRSRPAAPGRASSRPATSGRSMANSTKSASRSSTVGGSNTSNRRWA
jgi:transposase